MQSLAQLKSKILDLQSQIQATQAQITDYKTNGAYIDYYYTCICNNYLGKTKKSWCHLIDGIKTYFFTKTTELAQAQATLATLQNELITAQNSINFLLLLANAILQSLSTPPPSSKIQATQKVLKHIESLQDFIKAKPLSITALAQQAQQC